MNRRQRLDRSAVAGDIGVMKKKTGSRRLVLCNYTMDTSAAAAAAAVHNDVDIDQRLTAVVDMIQEASLHCIMTEIDNEIVKRTTAAAAGEDEMSSAAVENDKMI